MLLKFHGIYQQDDRDVRRARTQLKLPLDYSCMVRASVPGGSITSEQWLALDRVAALADQKLRLTTRQGVQYHVVHKGELRELVAGINSSLLTTLGACGDVVRNVMACPLPHPERRAVIEPLVAEMVARFRPQTESYWELWVDGERAVSAEPRPDVLDTIDDVEPIYGAAYLPRKFKIAIAWPGDNCVDIYTNDVGIVPTLSEGTTGELTGCVVLAGGGHGHGPQPARRHVSTARATRGMGAAGTRSATSSRRSSRRSVTTATVTIARAPASSTCWRSAGSTGCGRRSRTRTGRPLAPPVELPDWEVGAHHGWHDIDGAPDDGHDRALGLPVPSGKVAGGLRLALRRLIADGTVRGLRVTPRQDLLLLGVTDAEAVENVLRANGVRLADDQSPTRNLAIACPALPTCSKALGEAERVLPEVVDRLEKVLADTGNTGLPLRLNMTGCPNGCSRPYAAELGIVGRTKKNYDIFVGGSPSGDRLARLLRADVPLTDVPDLLRPLLEAFSRSDGATSFGDWCVAQDWSALEALLPEPTGRRRAR